MYDFYSGKTYTLMRKTSRKVEITAVVDWREPGLRRGHRVRHCLFSISRRQASKYGKETGPKLYLNRTYRIERRDGKVILMKLYRQKHGESGKRYLWMKKVARKRRP